MLAASKWKFIPVSRDFALVAVAGPSPCFQKPQPWRCDVVCGGGCTLVRFAACVREVVFRWAQPCPRVWDAVGRDQMHGGSSASHGPCI